MYGRVSLVADQAILYILQGRYCVMQNKGVAMRLPGIQHWVEGALCRIVWVWDS